MVPAALNDTTVLMTSLSAGSQHYMQGLTQAGAECTGAGLFSPWSLVFQQACVLSGPLGSRNKAVGHGEESSA